MSFSGKVLAETVLIEIENLTLDISNCRRLGYDVAASVSGHVNGISVELLRIIEKLYAIIVTVTN